MGYYDKRKQAFNQIEKMIQAEDSIDINIIKLYICENYGFGDKFVEAYLDKKFKAKQIKLAGDSVMWVKRK